MAKEYTTMHKTSYYEGDISNHITIGMLLNVLILASEEQNVELGIDHTTMKEQKIGWVVTSYELEVNQLPKVDQKIKITTSGTYYNKVFAFREFWVRDLDDNLLVKVDSIWVLMDAETRKIKRLPKELIDLYESELVKKMPKLMRPNKIEGDEYDAKLYQVRYSDIDFNGHVNNSHYLDWMIDSLSKDFLDQHTPVHLAIRFENEVMYGQLVDSKNEVVENITNHEISSDGILSASATIEWKNNN